MHQLRSLFIFPLLLAAIASGACKSQDSNTGDEGGASGPGVDGGPSTTSCVGGVVVNGRCEAKCQPSLCVADNTCVANHCRLKCASHLDCNLGQACTPVTEDDTGAAISVCLDGAVSAAIGAACVNGDECGGQLTCPDGSACGASVCGGGACSPDADACAAQAALSGDAGAGDCRLGKCDDGSPCVVPGCQPDQCKPLFCVTSGKGDATAFCSRADCANDAACGAGMQCQEQRDPHLLCGTKKGNSNACGKTTEPCVDPASFSAGGATYSEGPICLMHKVCAGRAACDPCESDLDCSLVPGRHCVEIAGAKACASDCKSNKDCLRSETCQNGECLPRFAGGCLGQGGFCEPCRTDLDCGDASSHMACVTGAVGERVCMDASFPTSCTRDADCPVAPSGLHGHCLSDADGVSSTDAVYHKCYLPFDGTNNVFSCWQAHN